MSFSNLASDKVTGFWKISEIYIFNNSCIFKITSKMAIAKFSCSHFESHRMLAKVKYKRSQNHPK